MANPINSIFHSIVAGAQARAAEAQARTAIAMANIEAASASIAQAKAAQLLLAPSVDPVEERNLRLMEWQKDPFAAVLQFRQLYEADSLASVVISRVVENEVGQGQEMEANTGDTQLNADIEGLWYDWYDTAEASGLGWDEFCQLSKIHELVDGDIATVLLNDAEQFQLVTADQIRSSAAGGNGVITNNIGRPVAYSIQSGSECVQYPASAVVFLARRKLLRNSIGTRQVRGTSIFSANYDLFAKAAKWRNAEVNAAIAAAKIVFWMVRNNPQGYLQGQPQNPSTGMRQLDLSQADKGLVLEPGEELKSFQGTHPTNNFSEPFRLLLRELGAEVGLPLEMLICDFSQGNYSSTRAALIFVQRAFNQRQAAFGSRYLGKIARWRINRWVVAGKLPDTSAVYNVRFIGPRWPVLDPLKEALAEMLWRDLGCRTHSDWCLEQGVDPMEQIAKIEKYLNLCREKHIPLYHSTSSTPLEAAPNATTTAADQTISLQ